MTDMISRALQQHEATVQRQEVFTEEELTRASGVYARLSRVFGFGSVTEVLALILACVVPLALLVPATMLEGRFALGSLTMPFEGGGRIVGMSFLGDPMVWPFCFIVPATLLLTKLAVSRSTDVMNEISSRISREWREQLDGDENGFDSAVRRAKTIFAGQNGFLGFALRVAPWIIALSFWGYNTLTCGFHEFLPLDIYPYKATEGILLRTAGGAEGASVVREAVEFGRVIDIPKWDCQPLAAPLSCWITRVWTLFYYGAIPFILMQLIRVIHGTMGFLLDIRQWERRNAGRSNAKALDINVFDQDGFGGLSRLADTGMSHLYAVSGFAVLVTMSFFKEGTAPSWHNYLLIAFFVPLAVGVFLIPPVIIRNSILEVKERYLAAISTEMNRLVKKSLDARPSEEARRQKFKENLELMYFRIGILNTIYQRINAVQEWPFTTSTMVRIFFSAGLPVLMIVMDKVIESFIL